MSRCVRWCVRLFHRRAFARPACIESAVLSHRSRSSGRRLSHSGRDGRYRFEPVALRSTDRSWPINLTNPSTLLSAGLGRYSAVISAGLHAVGLLDLSVCPCGVLCPHFALADIRTRISDPHSFPTRPRAGHSSLLRVSSLPPPDEPGNGVL
jgi:hypothetical protein